jgi:CubicO group peptidase (beta-lactamase class C family)
MWTSDTIQARLKAYEDELPLFMRDHHLPGLSIAITNRQEVVYAKAYGARQLATNLPNTVETPHGIGSVSKSLTCFALLQLAEQGKLSLEDPIRHYLDVSVDKDVHTPIRLRHLMSHTSGIPNLDIALVSIGRYLLNVEPFIPLSSDEDLFRYVNAAHERVLFPPGEKYFYFNGGFTLLAKIIEQVSGKTFSTYLRDHILTPLDMPQTCLDEVDVTSRTNVATGYHVHEGKAMPTAQMTDPYSQGAGGVISSVMEMSNYLRCYLNQGGSPTGPLLQPHTLAQMFVIQPGTENPYALFGTSGYGLGWGIMTDFLGQQVYQHGGSTLVSGAMALLVPDQDLGIMVVGNNGTAPIGIVALALLALLLGKHPHDVLPFFITKRKFALFAGDYRTHSGITSAKVFAKGGMLYLETTSKVFGTSTFPLIPDDPLITTNAFYTYEHGARIAVEFFVDAASKTPVHFKFERSLFTKQ